MEPSEIEATQESCFKEDFHRLGPAIYRAIETWHLGYSKLKKSSSAHLRLKADRLAAEIRHAYPVFLAGRLLGPTRIVRRRIADLESRIHADLGKPTWLERTQSLLALGMAAWTGLTLKLGLFQHPRLIRHTFRMPLETRPGRAWRRLRGQDSDGHRVEVEKRPWSTVWVSVHGSLAQAGAGRLATELGKVLERKKERLVLDLTRLARFESEAAHHMAEALRSHQHRVRILLPRAGEFASIAAIFSLYQ